MTAIDQLLARARLHHDAQVHPDTVPYEDCTYPDLTHDPATPRPDGADTDDRAAQHLHTLCEAVVTTAAPGALEFLTDQLPEPEGAWLLGCALHLAGIDDGSRFWWQYAAGAGHTPAAYCLSLHHLARGEAHAAGFWYDQTGLESVTDSETLTVTGAWPPHDQFRFDASVPTVLRVLNRLNTARPRPRTHRADAITNYVAHAVTHGYARHPGVEIPVPEPRFADRVSFILSATPPWRRRPARVLNPALPTRPEQVGRGATVDAAEG
ncbi:hypothetical protein [Streptomyces sp. NPDC001480]|uniref:hypothetical protein n=1 Tax=Streptomyces sp. NPDC001480 TaxID=3364577 RepID=UPI0036A7C9AF